MEGACGVRLNADDDVSEIFKNGRASISLGYIGIHTTVNRAVRRRACLRQRPASREKVSPLLNVVRQAVDEWKEETGYGFQSLQHAE
ncbi:anaerobic ribonucleoside-triphosphate reductase [Shigella flexneri]